MNKTQGTEPFNAPETKVEVVGVQAPPTPRQKTLERTGQRSEPYTRRLPQIRGGICEFCGVLDGKIASQDQWKLCPHFRGISEMRCSYCDESVNPEEIVLRSILNIAEHPDNPDKLVVWCNSYKCSGKHEKRFRVNR